MKKAPDNSARRIVSSYAMDRETHQQLRIEAARRDVSLRLMMTMVIRLGLERLGEEHPRPEQRAAA